jgi:hypothetical protein
MAGCEFAEVINNQQRSTNNNQQQSTNNNQPTTINQQQSTNNNQPLPRVVRDELVKIDK